MNKMKSLEELKAIRERAKQDTELRTTGEDKERIVVAVGMATCGIAAGAREVMSALSEEIGVKELGNVSVVATGCLGFCYAEPMVEVRTPGKEPIRYGNVNREIARAIIDMHICEGKFVEEAIFTKGVPKNE